jgi:hypothetical protein
MYSEHVAFCVGEFFPELDEIAHLPAERLIEAVHGQKIPQYPEAHFNVAFRAFEIRDNIHDIIYFFAREADKIAYSPEIQVGEYIFKIIRVRAQAIRGRFVRLPRVFAAAV